LTPASPRYNNFTVSVNVRAVAQHFCPPDSRDTRAWKKETMIPVRLVVLVIFTYFAITACGDTKDKVENVVPDSATSTKQATARATSVVTRQPTQTQAPKVREVAVQKFGFSPKTEFGSIGYGVVVRNQSTNEAVERVALQMAFYDAAGTVVGTSNATIAILQPGEVTGIGDSASVNGAPTDMKIQISTGKWSDFTKPLTVFQVTNLSLTPQQYSGPQVTGEIANPFTKDMKSVRLSAIFYDAAGGVVGGAFTYQEFIPAAGKAAFKITSFTDMSASAVEVYGQLSYITLSDLQ